MSEHVRPGDVTGLWASAQVSQLLADLDEGVELPEYGAVEWLELPGDDPRRPAALITAAEQWRRFVDREQLLDELAENNPSRWYAEVFGDADQAAVEWARSTEPWRHPTWVEISRRREMPPARPVVATPGWPPIAIPGRPGWWRHCIDGRQVDLPTRELPQQEAA